jgi:hypothetical protein
MTVFVVEGELVSVTEYKPQDQKREMRVVWEMSQVMRKLSRFGRLLKLSPTNSWKISSSAESSFFYIDKPIQVSSKITFLDIIIFLLS